MIRIAICDDSEKALNLVYQYVLDFAREQHEMAQIVKYTQSRMLEYDIKEGGYYDLILTDIEMPDLDGLELAKHIRTYLPDALLIFITAHLKYSIDAYAYSAFRYIPKNQWKSRLKDALNDALKWIHLQSEKSYIICTSRRMQKIHYKKIVLIRHFGKNVVFHLVDGDEVKVRKSLSQVYEELDTDDFAYADRGILVNLSHISAILPERMELDDGTVIQTNSTRTKQLRERLREFWSKNL